MKIFRIISYKLSKYRWYRHFYLYKFRQFMGWSYLKGCWHTKTELEYFDTTLIRLENKIDNLIEKYENKRNTRRVRERQE